MKQELLKALNKNRAGSRPVAVATLLDTGEQLSIFSNYGTKSVDYSAFTKARNKIVNLGIKAQNHVRSKR